MRVAAAASRANLNIVSGFSVRPGHGSQMGVDSRASNDGSRRFSNYGAPPLMNFALMSQFHGIGPNRGPNRGLFRDCEIFANFHLKL